jgi:uncharacterized repeat protein (TIGR01451 family)
MGNPFPGEDQLMGRLIRHLVSTAAVLLLLPGLALAQLIQNTATSELNALSLDLSQATVTLNRTSIVDPNNSSVTVDPPIVAADGVAFSIITVTLRDANNQPISGRLISIASDRGASDTITQPAAPTDANGVATGEIRSMLNGISQITATDVADNINLNDQPEVMFTLVRMIQLTKLVGPDRATIGDVVTYSIAIKNTDTDPVSNVRIVDEPSPVLAYVAGTARVDGVSIADPEPGAQLIFDVGDIDPLSDDNGNGVADPGEGGHHTLTYNMIVGAGARSGSYDNTAYAVDVCDSCVISASTSVELEITSDPIFDLGTVIGKVFYDEDGDGWQDQGETGISGAMVALDSGDYVLTDAHGRYHFPAIEPGQRMLKLNIHSIASNARATDGDKKVLTVTPGLMAKANFAVNYNFESESIGRDAEYGVRIDSTPDKLPDRIAGSASNLNAVVNGVRLQFAQIRASLSDADSNGILHLGEVGEIEPIRFDLSISDPTRAINGWTLNIWGDEGDLVKSISDQGALPEQVVWADTMEILQAMKPGRVYFYQLEIEEPDTRSTSSRGMFGINRNTSVSLKLAGGAFVVNSSELTDQAKMLLTEAAEIMREHPDEIIRINGHTDSTGTSEDNQSLSERRANSAFDYLVQTLGLPAERFIVTGYGEDKPVASNDTVEGRRMNRRVEIAGDLTEVERAQLYQTRTNEMLAILNGVEMALGSHGQFRTSIDGARSDVVTLELTNEIGAGIDTTIRLPKLTVIEPSGTEYRAFANGQSLSAADGSANLEGSLSYRLVGETDVGNHIELNQQVLEVDAAGRFEAQLDLTTGRNAHVLSARNEKGFVRYANVNINVRTDDYGEPIVAVEPIPKLVLQLPPKGVPMRSANLAIPGYTDPGNTVMINGQRIPVGPDGRFFAAMPLKLGSNTLTVVVSDRDEYTGSIEREIEYTGDALFIMALADGKISQITREGNLDAAGADSTSETVTEGRIAMYLKGTVLGKYLVTAAFDSGTNEIGELFNDLDAIENERLVRNLDPDRVYPVYGDDSTLVFDTESKGKLYLSFEGEDLEAFVGNYALNFSDTELMAYQRTLYGARAAWRSQGKTGDGQSNTELDVFVAQVDQVPVRDEIAASGGSLYFLSQADIIEGSEQVTLLVHDQHTGMLLQRITQQRNVDYTIKYREGRIWFTRPISSVIADGTLIGSNLLAGNPVSIQVDYETRVTGLDAGISGARFKQRLFDGMFSVGGMHVAEDAGTSQYTLNGVDAEVKLDTARIIAEFANSEGTDSQLFRSEDGGLQFNPVTAGPDKDGSAYKLAAEFDAGAWFGMDGRLVGSAYFKKQDAGFVSNGNFGQADEQQFGGVLNYRFDDANSFLLRIDDQARGDSAGSTLTSLNWQHSRDRLTLEGEYLDRQDVNPGTGGSAVAARAQYEWTSDFTTSLEHQQGLEGTGGTQSAASVEYAFRDKLSVSGHLVSSEDGIAYQGGASWDTPIGKLYAQQQFGGPDSGDKSSNTVLGAEAPFGSGGTVYTEYQWDRTGDKRGLRSISGMRRDWSLTDGLTLLFSGEQTMLLASDGGENKLNAIIGGASFDRNGLKLSSRNEWRQQRGSTLLDQFATFNHGELKLSSGLTMLGEYRQSTSDDLVQQDQSTAFQELSLGFAIRPIEHDRWNLLFKLARLDSDATPTQRDSHYDNSTADLISADWSVQLIRNIEWVGKHAMKKKLTEPTGYEGIETNTSLSIQRLNFAIPWDLSLGTEFRRLHQKEAQDTRSGWLGEVMWNGFENMGLGVGFNFTEFSSDLRFDSDYSEYGWFFRVQGRY